MKYIVNESNEARYNMAFDEYALQCLPLDEPVFFLWRNAPSVIIGLNQSAYAEVNLNYLDEQGISLARRVTGGGAVYHDLQNLNYTIAGKSSDLASDYPDYLHYVVNALRELGVPAELSGRNDIMVEGRKCSGFAKRVYKDRLMIHGTLMFDVDFEKLRKALSVPGSKLEASGVASVRSKVANLKEYLPQFDDILQFRDALHKILAAGDGELVLDASQLAQIEAEANEKFRTWDWVYGRSPEAAFRASRKFACGTVEVFWSVVHGQLCNISFGGDFLGNLAPEGIAARLDGVRFEREHILRALSDGNGPSVQDCFDSLTAEELADLLTVA
ncbi:MAG: lipoate--protein ligase [Bacteroidales bacterium]|nr:lipoate--protein ligase [Bacteroidales bacterium]